MPELTAGQPAPARSMAEAPDAALHGRCGAKRRQGGDPCTLAAGWGTDHPGAGCCRYHGGSSPSGRIAGRRTLELRAAEAAVRAYGLPVDIDPGTALLAEVQRTAGHVQWLGEKIAELDPDALVWGARSMAHQAGRTAEGLVDVTTIVEGASLNVWLELYLRERDHLRKVTSAALKAGIAERQVQLAEQAGERAGQWLRASLEVLKLSDEDMRQVMAAGVAHLHLLDSGA